MTACNPALVPASLNPPQNLSAQVHVLSAAPLTAPDCLEMASVPLACSPVGDKPSPRNSDSAVFPTSLSSGPYRQQDVMAWNSQERVWLSTGLQIKKRHSIQDRSQKLCHRWLAPSLCSTIQDPDLEIPDSSSPLSRFSPLPCESSLKGAAHICIVP